MDGEGYFIVTIASDPRMSECIIHVIPASSSSYLSSYSFFDIFSIKFCAISSERGGKLSFFNFSLNSSVFIPG